MSYGTRAAWEPLRLVAAGSVTASYAALGTALADYVRELTFKNNTDNTVLVSFDGTNDHLRFPANSAEAVDLTANKVRDDGLFVPKGTQIYVKHTGSAPTTGNFWVQLLYAQGGV